MKNQNPANYFNKLFSILIVVLFISVSVNGADLAITFNVSKYQNGNNISCFGAHDGMVEAVIVGGTSPYTYSWNTGSFNRVLTGIGSGNYTFTVTDATAQTVSSTVEMIEPAILEVTLLPEFYGGYNISEQGGNDGNIVSETKGGSQPYSYSWSNTSTEPSINGLTAGTYNLSVTDANGCTISGSKTLTEPTPLHIVSITSPQHHGYNVSCNKGHDGQIDLNVTGGVPPYKYDWSSGSFEEDINNLNAGEYSVRVTDANGAEILTSILLTEPTGTFKINMTPQVYANGFNLSCHDCANGSITAIGVNGVSPFSYLWSNSQTTATISGLQAIDYNCTMTDANGCTVIQALALHAPDRDDWSMNGNANVDSATQFMGTTDSRDFIFKTNNVERMRIRSTGVVQVHGGLKIDSVSTDSLRSVYVDQNGVLRTSGSIGSGGSGGSGTNCDGLANNWYRNVCSQFALPIIYLMPLSYSVGIGTKLPRDKIEVVGFGRFAGSLNDQDYINIGHDGNSRISSFGSGELLINENSTQNVKIATGVNSGDVSIGGNIFLATLRGRVFIGSASSISELQIGTKFTFRGDPANSIIGVNYSYYSGDDRRLVNGGVSRIVFGTNGEISAQIAPSGVAGSIIGVNDWNVAWRVNSDGKVGIGNFSTSVWEGTYRLYVKEGIRAEKVKVDIASTNNWADFVFAKDYKLTSLPDLQNFIQTRNHLPGIPSAEEVVSSGIDLAEMDARLLTKVEELTLYIFQLKKEIDQLKSVVSKKH